MKESSLTHFNAGYIVDSISSLITEHKFSLDKGNTVDCNQLNKINGLLKYVTSFDVEFPDKHLPNFRELNPVLATLSNVITRGLPTGNPGDIDHVKPEMIDHSIVVNLNFLKQ
jgi:ATP-dependent DNA helicase RecQ